jgi:putative ABC transport system permease protein
VVPIGESITINGQPFVVIGMFRHYESEEYRKRRQARLAAIARGEQPPSMGRDHFVYRLKNRTIYIPLSAMLLNFRTGSGVNAAADAQLSTLYMKIPDIALLEPALQQVRNVLMVNHAGLEDFSFRTDEDWANEISTTIRNYRMSGSIIAAICLIVGGIGIANIMLASISERVREIGIRKSVGATTLDVFVQILVESVVLTMLGGLAGLAVSFGLVVIVWWVLSAA